jgi:hypothetical protein
MNYDLDETVDSLKTVDVSSWKLDLRRKRKKRTISRTISYWTGLIRAQSDVIRRKSSDSDNNTHALKHVKYERRIKRDLARDVKMVFPGLHRY